VATSSPSPTLARPPSHTSIPLSFILMPMALHLPSTSPHERAKPGCENPIALPSHPNTGCLSWYHARHKHHDIFGSLSITQMASLNASPSRIETTILVVSDTHGMDFDPRIQRVLEQGADVAIHCGDLTEESKIDEFRSAIKLLKTINAPLKLVIAGNHDFTLDPPIFKQKVTEAHQPLEPALVEREYGAYGAARQLFDEAREHGIVLLDEGTHELILQNGAVMRVYASPYTPAPVPDWGFQFNPQCGRSFDIQEHTDIAITHGPPEGVLDRTDAHQRIGSSHLFGAVARARPRVHAFGHVHAGWGAKLVSWRPKVSEMPSHLTDIDNGKSYLIESLAGLRPSRFDAQEVAQAKLKKKEQLSAVGYSRALLFNDETRRPEAGTETLFINAAAEGGGEILTQVPWLVQLDLPRKPSSSKDLSSDTLLPTKGKRKSSGSSDDVDERAVKRQKPENR